MVRCNDYLFINIDIDECLSGPCEQWCRNLEGSYACSCREGFKKINTDPKSKECISKCKHAEPLSTPFIPFILFS